MPLALILPKGVCVYVCVFIKGAKKNEILDQGRDSLFFQVFPWHFYFMRGHSLVELTEHDDSAANIIDYRIWYVYVYVLLYS